MKFTTKGWASLKVTNESELPSHITLKISITDTGIGIKDADLKKLFSPFTQVDGYLQRQQHGSGLGLVITKQLLSLMDSKLVVESTFGKGSDFHFTVTLSKVFPMKPFFADHIFLSRESVPASITKVTSNGSHSVEMSNSSSVWTDRMDTLRRARSADNLGKTALVAHSSMDTASRPARYFYKLFIFIDGCPEVRRIFRKFENDLFVLTMTFPSIISFLEFLNLTDETLRELNYRRKNELCILNMDEDYISNYKYPNKKLDSEEIVKAKMLSKFIFDRHASASFQGIALLSIDDISLKEYYANVSKIHLPLLFPTFITTLNKAIAETGPYLQTKSYFCGLFRKERRHRLGMMYSMFSEQSDAHGAGRNNPNELIYIN